MTKKDRIDRKLKKMEEKYCPQKYFYFQRRTMKYSLEKSIDHTLCYINRNMRRYCSGNIFKTYGKIDFKSKQLFSLIASAYIGMITGFLVNLISIYFSDFSELIEQGPNVSTKLFLAVIVSAFELIIAIVIGFIIFFLIYAIRKDYYDEYNLFVAPYERKKAVEYIEKIIDNVNYKKTL